MLCFAITVAPRYYEVSRYRKKCSLLRGLRYSEDSVITNYLVNNKSIRCSGVTKLKQAEQWDIHQAKQSTDLRVNSYDWIKQSFEGQSFHILTNRSRVWLVNHLYQRTQYHAISDFNSLSQTINDSRNVNSFKRNVFFIIAIYI